MNSKSPQVIVVGGGVIGLASALELSRRRVSVTLLESASTLGTGVTGAALGGLTPQSETWCRGPLRHVALWSLELYEPFLQALTADTGLAVPVLETGQLEVALTEEALEHLTTSLLPIWKEEGFQTYILSRAETLQMEPQLTPTLAGAALLPIEVALEPSRLMYQLQVAATSHRDLKIWRDKQVNAVVSNAREAGVLLSDGTYLAADFVVVAAGMASTRLLPELNGKLYPMKGHALEFATKKDSYAFNHHIYAANGGPQRSAYLVPRIDGRVAAGVTYEPDDDTLDVNPSTIEAIKGGLVELCPAVASWAEIRRWAGVRPASRDGRPFIGFVDDNMRVVACCGHQGLGITMAPASGVMVSALITADTLGTPQLVDALRICDPRRNVIVDSEAMPPPVSMTTKGPDIGAYVSRRSLTSDERNALPVANNLADAHARQSMSSIERQLIVQKLPSFFERAVSASYQRLEIESALSFLHSIGQEVASDRVLATYSSSVSAMIISQLLKRKRVLASLTCPTFDNLHALLRWSDVPARPRMPWDDPSRLAPKVGCVFEVSPNNPTGEFLNKEALVALSESCARSGTILVLDQSFKGQDSRCCYDHYEILDGSGVSYAVIEDTGKLWPVGDLKVSYIVASADLFTTLRELTDDVLLNVAPFNLELVKNYSILSAKDNYATIRNLIAQNRGYLRAALGNLTSILRVAYEDSLVGVEVLQVEPAAYDRLRHSLDDRGIALLEVDKFYWNGSRTERPELRVSLCRSSEQFNLAIDAIASLANGL